MFLVSVLAQRGRHNKLFEDMLIHEDSAWDAYLQALNKLDRQWEPCMVTKLDKLKNGIAEDYLDRIGDAGNRIKSAPCAGAFELSRSLHRFNLHTFSWVPGWPFTLAYDTVTLCACVGPRPVWR